MDKKQYLLQVNNHLTFNVNTQINEQLKWLIGMGQIEPGDMLPSASHLADELELNRNTVNWVYTQLRDEGLVTMQKGRGTHVTGGAQTRQLRDERQRMRQLLDPILHEASQSGLDLPSFFIAGLAYTLLQNPPQASKLHILFVECRGHDHPFYRQAIELATGADVETLFLKDFTNEDQQALTEAVQRSHAIVTTLNHAEEVRTKFARFDSKIIVIGATIEPSVLLEVAGLKQGSHVIFACLGKTGGEWMANRIREAGIQQIQFDTLGLNEPERLREAARYSDKIYASGAAFPELKKLLPEKTELFPMKLEPSSENLLQELALQTPLHTR